MRKKLLALGLAGMMMLGALAGCGGGDTTPADKGSGDTAQADTGADTSKDNAKGSGDMKIGMSISSRDQFLSTLETAVSDAAKEAGVTFNSFDANNDIQLQINHVQTCAADNYDAIIINMVDSTNAKELIAAAGDMKVVFVNRGPDDMSVLNDNIMYVGSNELDSGRFQGEFLAKYFKEKNMTEANIVMMQGTLGLDHTNKRTSSSLKALEDAGIKVNIAYQDTAEYDRAKAMDKFTQFLGTGKPFDAVICNNDDMALGCIEAYKASGVTEIPVPIVGIDATKGGCEAIENGDLAFTVFQDPKGQGGGAIKCAMAMVKGEPVEGEEDHILWIPFEPVDKSNVAEYAAK
ncbi:substrate-binding domain-containing protein [Intestinibacillus massiliensis]|nr:substrate-binding domain-containing protein [Intestinibacillus massiliensis]